MNAILRAEFRKLLTVRSTYVIAILALLLVGFISFWVLGYKADMTSNGLYTESVNSAAGLLTLFLVITVILFVTHEYRFNTIMYTLTASNSRSKVLIAKILVISAYALVSLLVIALYAALLTWAGLEFRGGDPVAQQFFFSDLGWRIVFVTLGYVLLAMVIALLVRHVAGAIAIFLLAPTIEGSLSMLLKDNIKYFPFSALEEVMSGARMSPGKAALLFSVYLVVGWAIAWFLFLRRDAN